jgi:hypothetical protein
MFARLATSLLLLLPGACYNANYLRQQLLRTIRRVEGRKDRLAVTSDEDMRMLILDGEAWRVKLNKLIVNK